MNKFELLIGKGVEGGPDFDKTLDLCGVPNPANRLKLAEEEVLKSSCPRLVAIDADGPLVKPKFRLFPGDSLSPEALDLIQKIRGIKETCLIIVTSRPRDNNKPFKGRDLHHQLRGLGITDDQIMSPGNILVFPFFKFHMAHNDPAKKLGLKDPQSFVFLGDGYFDKMLYRKILENRPESSTNVFIRFPQAFFVPF